MNYSKPEVVTLGQAKSVIEVIPPTSKLSTQFDNGVPPKNRPNTAYDLDE